MNRRQSRIDQLFELAKNNPEELERYRQREIEALISNAPAHMQRRLRGLQFQVDCKRRLHPTPMGACVAISQMMLQSMEKLNLALHSGHTMTLNGERRSSAADIIRFPASPKAGGL